MRFTSKIQLFTFLFVFPIYLHGQQVQQGQHIAKGKPGKYKTVSVCHNGNTISVTQNDLQAHLDHGDYLGECVEEEMCATDVILGIQQETDPNFDEGTQLQEALIREALATGPSFGRAVGVDEFVIPVVVHVIYRDDDPGGNISYNQILSQLDAMNAAFRATSTGLDADIRFCLAETVVGPGAWTNPGTEPGVIRYEDNTPGHIYADNSLSIASTTDLLALTHSIPGSFPFDTYLNIWVVNTIDAPTLVQGYSPLPIMPETGSFGYLLDGVVIRHDVFGDNSNSSYCQCFDLQTSPAVRNLGQVMVHELGHYLRLYHTFHSNCSGMDDPNGTDDCALNGDFVCDTPPCIQPASTGTNCVSGTANTCTEGVTYANPVTEMQFNTPTDAFDLTEDYMYYAHDPCFSTFTQGQIDRMHAFIVTSRQNLTSLQNLQNVGVAYPGGCVPPEVAATILGPTAGCTDTTINFNTPTGSAYSATNWNWSFSPAGGFTFVGGTSSADPNIQIDFTTPGLYTITLDADDGVDFEQEVFTIFVDPCLPIDPTQAHWYFGYGLAVDFTSGLPAPNNSAISPSTTITALEAATCQSDAFGNLLFYTNGVDVWDNTHTTFNNLPLPGHSGLGWIPCASGQRIVNSAAQMISVPDPANQDFYYIFIPPSLEDGGVGFNFALFDMSSGTGGFVSQGAIPLPGGGTTLSEHVTAVPHCNGTDYWIIVHGKNNAEFYVYRLSDQGITNADMSLPTPDNYSFTIKLQQAGQLKASPDGKRLTMAPFPADIGLGVYDFDNSTGVISNEIWYNTPASHRFSGCSFSPNSLVLYGSTYLHGTPDELWQFDLTTGISRMVTTGSFGPMQLGPNDHLYIHPRSGNDFLTALDDPDSVAAPAYNSLAVDFSTVASCLRTMNQTPTLIDAIKPPVQTPDFTVNLLPSCDEIELQVDPCWATYDVLWNFDDGVTCSPAGNYGDVVTGCTNTSGTFDNPTHIYLADGTYTITMTLSIGSNTLPPVTQTVTILNSAPSIAGLLFACEDELTSYSVPFNPDYSYDWTVTGGTFGGGVTTATGSAVDVTWTPSGAGTLSLVCTSILNPVCTSSTSINVTVNPSPTIDAGPDLSLCPSAIPVALNAVTTGLNCTWSPVVPELSDPSICNPTYTPSTLGVTNFVVTTVDGNGCSTTDDLLITVSNTSAWPKQFSSADASNMGGGVAEDGNGNVYITGELGGTMNFPGIGNFTTVGSKDVYVAKYSSSCGLEWVRQFGAAGHDTGFDVAVDASGDVFVTGIFAGAVNFDAFPLNAVNTEQFVIKLDQTSGAVLAATQSSVVTAGPVPPVSMGIEVDQVSGAVYTTGRVSGTVNYGLFPLTATGPVTSSGPSDITLVKYNNATLTEQWARSFGSDNVDPPRKVGIDGAGNAYVVCLLAGDLTFGAIPILYPHSGGSSSDLCIVKYDAAGNEVVALVAGGTGSDNVNDIHVDNAGNCFITGNIQSSATFSPLAPTVGSGAFVAKLDNSLNGIWQHRMGPPGSGFPSGLAITVDNAGTVYFAGRMLGTIEFPGFTPSTIVGPPPFNNYDMYIGVIDAAGNPGNVSSAGSNSGYTFVSSMSANTAGAAYLTGGFNLTTTFGSTPLTSAFGSDIFTVRYDNTGTSSIAIEGTAENQAIPVEGDVESAIQGTAENQEISIEGDVESAIIYPNPSSGSIVVDLVTEKIYNEVQVFIIDIHGEILSTQERRLSADTRFEFDLQHYASGVYFARIITDGKVVNKKIALVKG